MYVREWQAVQRNGQPLRTMANKRIAAGNGQVKSRTPIPAIRSPRSNSQTGKAALPGRKCQPPCCAPCQAPARSGSRTPSTFKNAAIPITLQFPRRLPPAQRNDTSIRLSPEPSRVFATISGLPQAASQSADRTIFGRHAFDIPVVSSASIICSSFNSARDCERRSFPTHIQQTILT